MNFYKKLMRVISIITVISLVFSLVSFNAAADTCKSVTAVTDTAVAQGEYSLCYVNIDSTENLASLDVAVHYDPEKVKITGVYNSIGCTLYDSVIDSDNIRFSYILNGEGTSSETQLFYFEYRVLQNAEAGNAYFDITIGEAFDSNLEDVAVSGSRRAFSITKAVTTKHCTVYGKKSHSTKIEQEFTIDYHLSTAQIASGTAVITYDAEIFEIADITEGAFLSNKITDINTAPTGEIYISFVGTEYAKDTHFVSVTFKTIKNVKNTSKIVLKMPELTDKELNAVLSDGHTATVDVAFDETYTGDAPVLKLKGSFSYENRQITLSVSLAENSHLGAGDFVIEFDPNLLAYKSSEKGFSPSFFSIDDKNVESGKLKFNIVSLTDILTAETVLTAVFDVKYPYSGEKTDFSLFGSNFTDSLTEPILLNLIDDSVFLEYKVDFKNFDGSLLQSSLYRYGDTVQEPTAPKRNDDVYGKYVFIGWDKTVSPCTGDETYTAKYTLNYTDYKIIFKDWDGAVLSSDSYHYGDKITPPANPTRQADNTYTYSFIGWDKSVTTCEGNATFTAKYSNKYIDYTVVFKDWDGTVLSSDSYHYGDKITPPANPTKKGNNVYSYDFAGWDKNLVYDGNMTITAKYTENFICNHSNKTKTDAKTPNCSESGWSKYYTCNDCGYLLAADGKTKIDNIPMLPKDPNKHIDADDKWESNKTQHFHTCKCGTEFDFANHIYDNDCDTTCNICNAERSITHVYDNACDDECNICHAKRQVPPHVYDNGCDTTCNICNAIRKVSGHVYDNDLDGVCNECNHVRYSNAWITVDDNRYYYDEKGVIQTGWLCLDGTYYYLDTDGVMQTGWIALNGTWYYLDTDGKMLTGWQYIGESWYYFNVGGSMVANTWLGNFWMDASGKMAVNSWVYYNGTYYYVGADGAYQTGWICPNGTSWYCLDIGGRMMTGWQYISGSWYYFYAGGSMAAYTWLGNYWMNASGKMAVNSWVYYNGSYYYVGANGAYQTGWICPNGTSWYCLDVGGRMMTGWQYISGSWYYFYSGGSMASNCYIGNNWITASGKMA